MNHVEQPLLEAALRSFNQRPFSIIEIRTLPINAGVSKVHVHRFELTLEDGSTVRLVTKPCGLLERRTLAALNGQPSVPRAFVSDLTRDEVQAVVLTDAGETLLGWDLDAKRRAATALSAVHAHFWGCTEDLSWMPRLDRAYLEEFIIAHCWRRQWTRSLQNEAFMAAFSDWVQPVESSVQTLVDDLLEFEATANVNTLAHTDVYYGHIFEHDSRALVIDWGQARYAPPFLDLGDTFDTPEAVQAYRDGLAAHGITLPDDVFNAGYRLGRRFAGIRYVFWWLDSWQREPADWNREGLARMLGLAAGRL